MIALKKIVDQIEVRAVIGDLQRFIEGVQYDSRKVEKDHAFIAISGFRADGHKFVESAFQRGARVFFVEKEVNLPEATVVQVADTRLALAQIARLFYNFADRKLKLVGITGTNGKTTTAYLIHSILKAAHWKPGLISTIEYFDGKQKTLAERTTPESADLYRLLHSMVGNGCKSAVMEVSSHALSLNRVAGLRFEAGVFTNLGRDHLDFHTSTEKYFRAKRRLFENFSENQRAVLNLDDPRFPELQRITDGEIFTFSMQHPQATVKYLSHQYLADGQRLRLKLPSSEVEIKTSLPGSFNIYNILAAATTAVALGLNEEMIVTGIQKLERIPGRCELFLSPAGFPVFVDYAHTPEGLRNLLSAFLESRPEKLIVVFGAGGDRDRGKRPEMGRVADDFADQIILTDDNPRSEEPAEIIREIQSGIFDLRKVTVIHDRREAVCEGIARAGKGDVVVIAGKGHELFQEIAGQKIPMDDRQIVLDYFAQRGWGKEQIHS